MQGQKGKEKPELLSEKSSLRNRSSQRVREKEGAVPSNQAMLALIIMMGRIKWRCHFCRFISSSLFSKFINMKIKRLSCCI